MHACDWTVRPHCVTTHRCHLAPPGTPCSTSSSLEEWLLYDGMKAQLLDPQLALPTVQFVELQVGGGVGEMGGKLDAVCWDARGARRIDAVLPTEIRNPFTVCPVQARWLVSLLQRGPEAAKAAFAVIPESVVRDMTAWLRCGGGGVCVCLGTLRALGLAELSTSNCV